MSSIASSLVVMACSAWLLGLREYLLEIARGDACCGGRLLARPDQLADVADECSAEPLDGLGAENIRAEGPVHSEALLIHVLLHDRIDLEPMEPPRPGRAERPDPWIWIAQKPEHRRRWADRREPLPHRCVAREVAEEAETDPAARDASDRVLHTC